MLEDQSEENGATRLVPGSHLWPELPEHKPEVESIAATGAAGTMLMFDRRLWHGTGANRTTRKRQTISVTNAEEARTLTPGGSPLRSDGGDCEAQPDGG